MISNGMQKCKKKWRAVQMWMYKLDEYLLCITTTTKSCIWGLKMDRIKMHENYSIKVEIWVSGVKEF